MTVKAALSATLAVLAGMTAAVAELPDSISIPEGEFETRDYKDIPIPDPSGHPVQQMLDTMGMDMRGTLPEHVLEEMLGATPYDFTDVAWGLDVTGGFTQAERGRGTLQVINLTEGLGAEGRINPDRFTGRMGFRMYNAQLDTDGDYTLTVSAIFPADEGGETMAIPIDRSRAVFEMTFGCHMFEPWRTGCADGSDEYLYTDVPTVQNMHVRKRGDSYRIHFVARVEEWRFQPPRDNFQRVPTGRVGLVRGWICDVASWESDPDACLPDDPLSVVANSPDHGRENVNLETPGIEIVFSEPVDIDSLEDSFSLSTRDRQGGRIDVSGEIEARSPTRYVFEPDDELESGVRYEARVSGGEDGVLVRDRNRHMEADHWWRFSTLVDLALHDGPADDPMEIDVHQTIRNAPLVDGKPAVLRVNAEWSEHPHIHPDWQPTSYEAELRLNVISSENWRIDAQLDGPVEDNVLRVIRPDQLTDSEVRRHARNTINVFGWSPDRRGDSTLIEARLRPHDPYPVPLEPQDVIAERRVPNWMADPDPLVLRYAFYTAGDWSDGVPESDRQLARAVVGMAEEFAQQIFPLQEVRSVFTGVEAAPAGEGVSPVRSMLRNMRGDPGIGADPEDVLIVFVPSDVLVDSEGRPYSGGNIGHRYGTEPQRGVVQEITESVGAVTVPVSMQAQVLVHEVGHNLGLGHRAGEAEDLRDIGLTPGGFADPGIEGFRIALDGLSGWNKSYEEGNAQWHGVPTPLMWPSPLVLDRVWINESEYQSLMDTFSR